jgi:hypothetical protein
MSILFDFYVTNKIYINIYITFNKYHKYRCDEFKQIVLIRRNHKEYPYYLHLK